MSARENEMKAISRLFWSLVAGSFLGTGIAFFSVLIGKGGEELGFTAWTFWYYTICMGLCVGLLVGFDTVRKHAAWMLAFVIAIGLVMSVGFVGMMDVQATGDMVERMQQQAQAMAQLMAQVVMYVAPGGVALAYGLVAYDTVRSQAGCRLAAR